MVVLLIATLVIMIISDFKNRYVYIWQLSLFCVVQLIYCFITFGKGIMAQNALINSIFLLFLSLCIGIYIILRFRKKKELIGWGDILFVMCLTPYFDLYRFLLFMIISMLASLGGWAICYFRGQRSREIPLISTLGICYSILLIYDNVITG